MKKITLFFLICFGSLSICQSQEWMTSIEVAKSLAYVQDKFLFVIWEGVSYEEYPVIIKNDKSVSVVVDLFNNEN